MEMIGTYNLSYWKGQVIKICSEIDEKMLKITEDSRSSISSDSLKLLRDLVDHVSVCCLLRTSDKSYETQYEYIKNGIRFINTNGQFALLSSFHKQLEASVSHYALFGDQAERLMLKYLDKLVKLKVFLQKELKIEVLNNIGLFPLDLDKTFENYYKEIIKVMSKISFGKTSEKQKYTYYVLKKKAIYCDNILFFEYTIASANDSLSKFDRFTAFSTIDVYENYAIKASFSKLPVQLFNEQISLSFLTDYRVAVRPCEFEKLFMIIGLSKNKKYSPSLDYGKLMMYIQTNKISLDEILDKDDSLYKEFLKSVFQNNKTFLYNFLNKSRTIIHSNHIGANVYRYLLHTINNRIIKQQIPHQNKFPISNELYIDSADRLFDAMPFVFSLLGHNPKFEVLCDTFSLNDHANELIKRFVIRKSEENSTLYNQIESNKPKDAIKNLVDSFNSLCIEKGFHDKYQLNLFKNFIYEYGAELKCHNLIKRFLDLANKSSEVNLNKYILSRLHELDLNIEDSQKKDALKTMFSNGRLFAVYGSAGTGKTTFANYVLKVLGKDTRVICVTNTNPALVNLENKLQCSSASYFTTYKVKHSSIDVPFICDLLIIDECSTISNNDIEFLLNKINFKFILLLGDIHQIESIQFGNWFSLLHYFLPKETQTELTTQFRAVSPNLPVLWKEIRENGQKIQELLNKMEVSKPLGNDIFERKYLDEIVLCLNYDGLYGINNINNYLQKRNANKPYNWKQYTFKIGDPILFIETSRFGSTLFNNLKGCIKSIIIDGNKNIYFEILIDRSLNPVHSYPGGIKILENYSDGKTLISFWVRNARAEDYDNDMTEECQIPFQIAYAVSIHKAQGLEYDSVKIVITNEVEELITHNIFYTSVTRAKKDLTIFWSPETEKKIINSLSFKDAKTDSNIMKAKFSDLCEAKN